MIEWVNFPHVVAKAYSHQPKIERTLVFRNQKFSADLEGISFREFAVALLVGG